MGKVFGYPKFDEKGEMILTTYDNEYKAMMMDIRVYQELLPGGGGDSGSSSVRQGHLWLGWKDGDRKQEGCVYGRTLVRACVYRAQGGCDGRGGCGDSGAVYQE